MILTLEITTPQPGLSGDRTRQQFTEAGGTIGRAGRNSWVLPHKEVSGQHAVISFQGGIFYIEDTSTNGVSVNSPENRLVRERPYALKPGDRLFIQPYVIAVSIAGATTPAPPPRFQRDDDPFATLGGAPVPPPPVVDSGAVDPLDFFPPLPSQTPPPRKPAVAPSAAGDILLGAHFDLPTPAVPAPSPSFAQPKQDTGGIPLDYDPLKDDPFATAPAPVPSSVVVPTPGAGRPPIDVVPRPRIEKPRYEPPPPPPLPPPPPAVPAWTAPEPSVPIAPLPPPPPIESLMVVEAQPVVEEPIVVVEPRMPMEVPPPPPPPPSMPIPVGSQAFEGEGLADLAQMLAGAGLSNVPINPELMRNLGQILRVVVTGVMDVLHARQHIKEEFQMRLTTVRPADNNPLKFSANVEDALHNLLVKRNSAYLGPVDAFRDAFDDLRHHQLAMLAGMRVAFQSMLAEFDPERMQEEFDRQIGSAMALKPASMRYWELYREKRHGMLADPEAAFARLFGEEFARAYEEQFRRLKAERRGGGQKPGHPPHDK